MSPEEEYIAAKLQAVENGLNKLEELIEARPGQARVAELKTEALLDKQEGLNRLLVRIQDGEMDVILPPSSEQIERMKESASKVARIIAANTTAIAIMQLVTDALNGAKVDA